MCTILGRLLRNDIIWMRKVFSPTKKSKITGDGKAACTLAGDNNEPATAGEIVSPAVTFPIVVTTEKNQEDSSLLDNKAFVTLVEECVAIIKEFESFCTEPITEAEKNMALLTIERLTQALELSGLIRIPDEFSFNRNRHEVDHSVKPKTYVADGKEITEIIAPGLYIENRVFIKSKVKV